MDNALALRLKPLIIPVFIPHAGCPHRCVFCDQTAITNQGQSLPNLDSLVRQVDSLRASSRRSHKTVQLAFYGGNFLGLPEGTVRRLLKEAVRYIQAGLVDSVRFSTRPDTIDEDRLQWLKNVPMAAVELGVQSMDDGVLALSDRGHTAADTEKAVELLRHHRFRTGIQLMPGLPGDHETCTVESAQKAADLSPDFVRLYPTLVLRNSRLARIYREGKYEPLSLRAAVSICRKIYRIFEAHSIPVIRMGLQASENLDSGTEILAGPYHPAFGQLVYAELFLEKARLLLQAEPLRSESVTFRVHPHSLSRLQGIRRQNIRILKEEFCLRSIAVLADDTLLQNELKIGA